MSIFDVIRYPVNEEFNPEDLDRIPPNILEAWWQQDISAAVLPTPEVIHSALSICSDDFRQRLLEKLKTRIRNYDNLPCTEVHAAKIA